MNAVGAEAFAEVAVRALERMAFVFTEPSDQGPGEVLAHPVVSAQVPIEREALLLRLCVTATHDFLGEVASAMLGLEQSEIDVDEHGTATVSELANVLGGELLMAMGGGEEPLRLGLPVLVTDEAAGALADASLAHGTTLVLQTDTGGILMLSWGPK